MITMLGSSLTSLILFLIIFLLEVLLLLISRKKEFSNKKTFTVLFVPFGIFVLLTLIWLFAIQPKWKSDVMDKIEKADYCKIDDDCVLITDFNCGSYINKSEVDETQKDLDLYNLMSIEPVCSSWGKAGRMSETEPKCENNKCVTQFNF